MFRYSKTKAIDFLDTYEMLLKNKKDLEVLYAEVLDLKELLIIANEEVFKLTNELKLIVGVEEEEEIIIS